METDHIGRILRKGEFKDECVRHLRSLELSAYCQCMMAFRASGGLDQPKKDLIEFIKKCFNIPDSRHQAEIRRIAADDKLITIADTISGKFTSLEWTEQGYEVAPPIQYITPVLSDEEIVRKVIEFRLKLVGAEQDNEDVVLPPKIVIDKEEEKLRVEEPIVIDVKPKALVPYPALKEHLLVSGMLKPELFPLTYSSNAEIKDDESTASENTRKRKRKVSRDHDNQTSVSPDITNLPSDEVRKKNVADDISSRLSFTSTSDIERVQRRVERLKEAEEAKKLKARAKPGRKKRISQPPEEDKSKRESSISSGSSSSSYASAADAVEQIRKEMVTKPTRGRGLSRVRGRSLPIYAGRGRGRGRGRISTSNLRPWPTELPPQFPLQPEPFSHESIPVPPGPSQNLGRLPKIKGNGEEIKKRAPYKKKKPNFQPLSNDNNMSNDTSSGVLKETQKMSQEPLPMYRDKSKMSSNFDQHHGINQYYDSYNYDSHHPPGQTHSYNPNSFPIRPHYPEPNYHHGEPSSKIRQKTKHTVIIQDQHESFGTRNTPNFVGYNESNLTRPTPPLGTLPPPSIPTNSVIVRTPSVSLPPNTPPKIINPMGMAKTHITITQNQKPIVNYSPHVSHRVPHEAQNFTNPKATPHHYRTPLSTSISNNIVTHKKRTQNLAAATTYTPQPDFVSSEGNNSGDTAHTQHPNMGLVNSNHSTVGATTSSSWVATTATASSLPVASSLAPRSRMFPYESKPPVSSTTTTSTALPVLTSVVRSLPLPAQTNSITTPVIHQRKAQPHILATSKIHRNSTVGVIPTAGTSSSTSTTQGVGLTTPATVNTNNSVIQNLTPTSSLPSLQATSVSIQNFNIVNPSPNIVSLGKPNIPIPSSNTLSMTRPSSSNIILVQKNPNMNAPGQTERPTSSTPQPGSVVKGPAKAVILRRANNSNLVIFDLKKNQLMSSPVSQLLQGARILGGPQVMNQTSLTGTPVRAIIQTTTGKMLTPSTTIITSTAASMTPTVMKSKNMTTTAGNSVAITMEKNPHISTSTSHSTTIQSPNKPMMAIRPVGFNTNRPEIIGRGNLGNRDEVSGVSTITIIPASQSSRNENTTTIGGNNLLENNSGNSISTDTGNESEINTSLLSDEVIDNSPPPETIEEDIIEMSSSVSGNHPIGEIPSSYKNLTTQKTVISVTMGNTLSLENTRTIESIRSVNLSGHRHEGTERSILNQVLLANRRTTYESNIQETESRKIDLDEDEFEEGDDDEDQFEDEDIQEEEESQGDEQGDEEEEEIELIDLVDDDPIPTPKLSNPIPISSNVNCVTEIIGHGTIRGQNINLIPQVTLAKSNTPTPVVGKNLNIQGCSPVEGINQVMEKITEPKINEDKTVSR